MSRFVTLFTATLLLFCLFQSPTAAAYPDSALIIDHTAIDGFARIPTTVINTVKNNFKIHYAHTSHGSQLISGLMALDQAQYPFLVTVSTTPQFDSRSNFIQMYDGTPLGTYATPDFYWDGQTGINATISTLNTLIPKGLTTTAFMWCTQLDTADAAYVSRYLAQMLAFQTQYPNLDVILMTGNAQATSYNRALRNDQIRQFAVANKMTLYDFGDLDSWYNGTQQTCTDGTHNFPCEHAAYKPNEVCCGHTNDLNMHNKALAFWYLAARLSGWNDSSTPTPTLSPTPSPSYSNLLNFLNHFTTIFDFNTLLRGLYK
jgi:hypothetical protein